MLWDIHQVRESRRMAQLEQTSSSLMYAATKSREHMSRITTPGLTARRVAPWVIHSPPPALAAMDRNTWRRHRNRTDGITDWSVRVKSTDKRRILFGVVARCRVSVKAEIGQQCGSDSSSNYWYCYLHPQATARSRVRVKKKKEKTKYARTDAPTCWRVNS